MGCEVDPLATLEEMVNSFNAGGHKPEFSTGGKSYGKGKTEKHEVGFCILEKAGLLTLKDTHDFLAMVQVRLATCCTKESTKEWGMSKIQEPYDLLHKVWKSPQPSSVEGPRYRHSLRT